MATVVSALPFAVTLVLGVELGDFATDNFALDGFESSAFAADGFAIDSFATDVFTSGDFALGWDITSDLETNLGLFITTGLATMFGLGEDLAKPFFELAASGAALEDAMTFPGCFTGAFFAAVVFLLTCLAPDFTSGPFVIQVTR
ncbi:MAG: hypothetical protein ABSH22_03545 [Tepidisphaeraceae bacterium]